MSNDAASIAPVDPVTAPVAGSVKEARQGLAITKNTVTESVTGNEPLPAEVREIIRWQAQVEAAVRPIKSGKAGQVEAIEIIFDCKRSGRADSKYARARAAVLANGELGPAFRQDDGSLAPAFYPVSGTRLRAVAEAEPVEQ